MGFSRQVMILGLLGWLVLSSGGCGLAVVPGMVGIGAGGYLWGKQHGKDQAEEKVPHNSPDEQSAPAAPTGAK